ncbi:MAG: carboxypeptidase-like regulatory domain-containing protein [Prolixibacteraceae bacterium]
MKKFILLLFLLPTISLSAQKQTVYGYIKDKISGECLIGATVTVENKTIGTTTNNFGFYSLTLPPGKQTLAYSFIGYHSIIKEIILSGETNLNMELEAQSSELGEVLVAGTKNNKVRNNELGSQSLSISTIKQLPAAMGEPDIVKSLQLLPGIQTSHEGTTNLSVRGGSFDQNLFLLDDAPVYNPSHALGFFSVFNSDAIKSVKIYKASFPAQYGGRLSSIVDIHMKEGNNKALSCNGGIGLIASRLTLEGPITKNKSSFIVSGRYSYAGETFNNAGQLGQYIGMKSLRNFNANNEITFYDLNAKINFELNSKNRLFLSAYSGADHFYYYAIDDNSSMDWGNITGTARWNHVFNSRLFANTMLVYSKYNYSYILKDDARHFKWSSDMKEIDLKTDFDFFPNPNNHIKFGWSAENHHYFPGKVEPRDSTSITKPFTLDKQRAKIGAIYINNEQKINDKIGMDYGLRYSTFFLLGESTVYSYFSDFSIKDSIQYSNGQLVQFYNGLEPRVTARYLLNANSSIKLSYSKTIQFQHLIGNSSVGFPSDVWVPASKYIKPQSANQIALGYYKLFQTKHYEFYTEAYYRTIHNIIDYKDNADLFLNPHVETQVLDGQGKSYGIEFFLEKKVGKLYGWLSYTLSKTTKQIDGINGNDPYPAGYDKRHNFSAVLNYKLSPSWSTSTIFKYTSGGYATVPEGTFDYYGSSFNYYTSRNGYKLPPYHRLDVSFTYKSGRNNYRKWKTDWNLGIYNVYNRKNIFALFIKQDVDNLASASAFKMYLFGLTPFLSYNFKF